ncbi:hypothetical protein MKW94_013643 [Papaver nudicaule]|uniref:GDSL esterase/lipase n=1 Tax=Papaver nudicaule TaxID=74823 RepID=A0AA41SFA1_PAPNU|nr:hypothetical protein [Papaver nudicaule]
MNGGRFIYYCDGHLIVDFMAEELGIPYLRAYLDSLGLSSFKTGANFATGGSSIREPRWSPLKIQIAQVRQFKARIIDIANSTQGKADLPKPEDFSKALYTFDIGQNDLSYTLQTTSETETRAAVPNILDILSTAIQQLYSEGARVFWVHNTGPIGYLDKNGCVVRLNEIAEEFNRRLKSNLTQLKANLTSAAFTYVDAYTAKYTLINNAESQVGTPYYGPCAHPEKHISWDATHYTEAANRWVSNYILNGSMSDPPIPISQACHA